MSIRVYTCLYVSILCFRATCLIWLACLSCSRTCFHEGFGTQIDAKIDTKSVCLSLFLSRFTMPKIDACLFPCSSFLLSPDLKSLLLLNFFFRIIVVEIYGKPKILGSRLSRSSGSSTVVSPHLLSSLLLTHLVTHAWLVGPMIDYLLSTCVWSWAKK